MGSKKVRGKGRIPNGHQNESETKAEPVSKLYQGQNCHIGKKKRKKKKEKKKKGKVVGFLCFSLFFKIY